MNEHERINAAVKKYIDGDKKAFTEIYELTYQATYYYVIGAVKNKEAAEDIISDTYLEVVKSIGTLSSPKAFVSWLRTIAHSKICRYFKKNGREVLVTEEEEPIFDTIENENEEFIPAVALEKESDRNEIIRIINGLSDVQKQTVFMHYFDKMPVAKIAEAMECSENTVKSRLNYARKALKDMFVAEEKKGNKFYSVAPFMFMLFSEEVQAVRVSAELSKRIIESAEVGAAATAAGSGIIGTIKGFFSTAAGKFAAASTAAKAGIGVGVAAVVATACIVPTVVNEEFKKPYKDIGEHRFYYTDVYTNVMEMKYYDAYFSIDTENISESIKTSVEEDRNEMLEQYEAFCNDYSNLRADLTEEDIETFDSVIKSYKAFKTESKDVSKSIAYLYNARNKHYGDFKRWTNLDWTYTDTLYTSYYPMGYDEEKDMVDIWVNVNDILGDYTDHINNICDCIDFLNECPYMTASELKVYNDVILAAQAVEEWYPVVQAAHVNIQKGIDTEKVKGHVESELKKYNKYEKAYNRLKNCTIPDLNVIQEEIDKED